MTCTVTDDASGVTIHTGPSELDPGKVNVAIYGPSREAVQQIIFDLAEEYACVDFQNPAPCSNGARWGAIGRVW